MSIFEKRPDTDNTVQNNTVEEQNTPQDVITPKKNLRASKTTKNKRKKTNDKEVVDNSETSVLKIWVQPKWRMLKNWVDFISSWILPLDALLWWWYAVGKIVELAWWENVWKTTLVCKWWVEAQKLNKKFLFIDAENAMSDERLESLWVNIHKWFKMVKEDIVEKVFTEVKKWLDDWYKFIVIDSVWEMLASRESLDNSDPWTSPFMVKAKIISTALNQIKSYVYKEWAVLILINQYYSTMATYWDPKKTKWWDMIRYVSSQRLEFIWSNTKSKQIWDENNMTMQELKVNLVKTKCLHPINFGTTTLIIDYISGQIFEYTWLVIMLKAWDILKLEWKTYHYLWEEIWWAVKLKNWIIKNKEQVYSDIKSRYCDMWYERECFARNRAALPF